MIKPWDAKYKVYYIEYDENRNEIARGVDSREYINWGNAMNRARKLGYTDRKRYDCQIAWRDPWVKYTEKVKCSICGVEYDCPLSHEGYRRDITLHITDHNAPRGCAHANSFSHICPECYEKIKTFIDDLKKKEDAE